MCITFYRVGYESRIAVPEAFADQADQYRADMIPAYWLADLDRLKVAVGSKVAAGKVTKTAVVVEKEGRTSFAGELESRDLANSALGMAFHLGVVVNLCRVPRRRAA